MPKHYASRSVRLLMPGDVVVEGNSKYKITEVRHTQYTTRIHYEDGSFEVYDLPDRETRVLIDQPAIKRSRRVPATKKRGMTPKVSTRVDRKSGTVGKTGTQLEIVAI